MPAYNAAKTIQESIDSILKQTYPEWELIIVNDCSTDKTTEIVESYIQNDHRIKLIPHERNLGLSAARNTGAKHASGNYIAFLDSDDLWFPDKLKEQILYHQKHPEILISHTDLNSFNENGILKRPWNSFMTGNRVKQGNLLPTLYYKNVIGVLTVMMTRQLFEEMKGFDVSLWTFEDQDLWIRIAEKGKRFGYVNKVLASYRISPNSLSRTLGKYKRAHKKLIKKYSSHNLNKNIILGNYYRSFATVYFKRGNYKLANLYFKKSLRYHGLRFISITTLLYMQLNYYRLITNT